MLAKAVIAAVTAAAAARIEIMAVIEFMASSPWPVLGRSPAGIL